MALVDIQVPDIGDFDEVTVIELLVKPGDTVAAEQSLITVESDKASMEIPSSHAGVVKEIKIKLDDKVKQGSVVLTLEVAGAAESEPKQAPAQAAPAAAAPKTEAAAAPAPAAPAAAPTAAASGPVEVKVPDIGDFKDVVVIEVLVKAGDTVKVEQSLVTVESDKASMEIPSSHAGVIKELKVKLGDTVNIGDLLAILEGSSAPAAVPPRKQPALLHRGHPSDLGQRTVAVPGDGSIGQKTGQRHACAVAGCCAGRAAGHENQAGLAALVQCVVHSLPAGV